MAFSLDLRWHMQKRTGYVHFTNLKNGTILSKRNPDRDDYMNIACFSPDGSHIAWGVNNILRVWSRRTRKFVDIEHHHDSLINFACFSNNNRYILSYTGGGEKCFIFCTSSGKEMFRFDTPTPVGEVCFSPNDRLLCIALYNNEVHIYDISEQDSTRKICILKGDYGYATSLCFSPDNSKIAISDNMKTVGIWSIPRGESNGCNVIAYTHAQWDENDHLIVNVIESMCFSPDGRYLVTLDDSGCFRIYSKTYWHQCVFFYSAVVSCYSFSPCGNYILLRFSFTYQHPHMEKVRYGLICGQTFVTIFTGLETFDNQWLDWNA